MTDKMPDEYDRLKAQADEILDYKTQGLWSLVDELIHYTSHGEGDDPAVAEIAKKLKDYTEQSRLIYVQWTDDEKTMRKWSSEPFQDGRPYMARADNNALTKAVEALKLIAEHGDLITEERTREIARNALKEIEASR